MRINSISKSLNRELESNVHLMAKAFEIQKLKKYEHFNRDVIIAPNGDSTFLLTNFNDGVVLFDIIPVKTNLSLEMMKRGSFKKLIEIKKGRVVPLKSSLVGSALPTRP